MKPTKPKENMKKITAYYLYEEMEKNKDIWVVTADLGFNMLDSIRDDFPDRYINVGAAEQAGMGVCVGLALEGKIPVFYSITPFAIFRPAETIRIYLNHEQIPVKILGSGRNNDYEHEGFSHFAHDTKDFLDTFPNIKQYWPSQNERIKKVLNSMLYNGKPSFMSLRKG